jgi:hypothetical protein
MARLHTKWAKIFAEVGRWPKLKRAGERNLERNVDAGKRNL